jgi:hypothetical protein
MRSKILMGLCLTGGLALSACSAKDDGDTGLTGGTNATNNAETSGGETGNGDDSTGAAESMSTNPSDTGNDTTGDGESTGGPVTGITMGFLIEPDGGGVNIECDVWAQDCPDEEKCMPWANDGGSSWNATRCSPLDPAPTQPGDECTVEGSGISGIDNCDLSSMCWDVDPETNMGTCVAFCMGSEANPVCEDPNTSCVIANEGVLILCLPNCDPLLQDCAEGQGCYAVNDAFACAPDAGAEGVGAYGDDCGFVNDCDPGLFCSDPAAVPGCAGTGCCSPFCDLSDPGATAACPGNAGGQECTAWYAEGQAPPGFEDVGACLIPM